MNNLRLLKYFSLFLWDFLSRHLWFFTSTLAPLILVNTEWYLKYKLLSEPGKTSVLHVDAPAHVQAICAVNEVCTSFESQFYCLQAADHGHVT